MSPKIESYGEGLSHHSFDKATQLLSAASNPEALARLSPYDRAKLGKMLKILSARIKNPLLYRVFPDTGPLRRELYPRQMENFKAGLNYKERLFMAANRVGKTFGGATETSFHGIGWYPDWWPGWVNTEPGEMIIGSKTTGTIKKNHPVGFVRAQHQGR